jgi:hypothetical protein
MDDDEGAYAPNYFWWLVKRFAQKALAFAAYFAATGVLLAAYDALVLFAITLGVVGEWRDRTAFAFLTLLAGIPAALAIGLLAFARRYTRVGWFALALVALTLVVVLFVNAMFLGCHPIWEGRGRCT